jgi:F0F1-type ATP synthase membrane subunit b/b'
MQEMRTIAADLAMQAAAKLIQSSLTEQKQREIVDEFLNEVDQKTAN